jgi:membrane protein
MLYRFKKLIRFIKLLVAKVQDDSIPALSAQITYFLLLAFFPFMIFLVSLFSYTNLTYYTVNLMKFQILPTALSELIKSVVDNAVENRNYTLLSLGMVITLWSASSGIVSLMVGISRAYGKEDRSFIKLRVLSVSYTILFSVIILFSITLLVLGELLSQYLFDMDGKGIYYEIFWDTMRYLGAAAVLTLLFLILFRNIPRRHLKLIQVLPGALLTSVGWIVLSTGFSFYVNNFSKLSYTYGSIGAVFALLLWLYWSCMVVLIGNEFNAVRLRKVLEHSGG